jgi:hypothetical protein
MDAKQACFISMLDMPQIKINLDKSFYSIILFVHLLMGLTDISSWLKKQRWMNVKCNKQMRINGTCYFKSEYLMFNAVFMENSEEITTIRLPDV